jgi:hypothetical protein
MIVLPAGIGVLELAARGKETGTTWRDIRRKSVSSLLPTVMF